MENETKYGFTHMSLKKWRQFYEIDIDFHPNLTILTGANGAGKSTVLSILESNLSGGTNERYLATPVESKSDSQTKFSFSTLFSRINPFSSDTKPNSNDQEKTHIGRIDYQIDPNILNDKHTVQITLPS
jgi:predicted ATP-binding protein involved in virulence